MLDKRARKTYQGDELTGVDLEDILFETCQFVAPNFTDTRFAGVVFDGCKLVGADFRKCRAFPSVDIRFENCVMDGCNFSELSLKDVKFVACDLRRCTFLRTNLTGADFSHSDLAESLFHGCDLTRTDFSRSRNYAIDPNANTLAKTKFSLPEAVSLLRGFDIELRDNI